MGIFNSKQSGGFEQKMASPVLQADQNCQNASAAVNQAIFELGQKYFEANHDNPDAEFSDLINKVNECKKNEMLWHQYRLSLDGKMKCEKCGAIITSDSAFCNKCGVSVAPLDFSAIMPTQPQPVSEPVAKVCPSCGNPVNEGDVFCEKCGQKI